MGKLLRFIVWTAGLLAVLALVLRVLVFKVWTVPDDPELAASVAPSLQGGDVVLVLTRGKPAFGELVRCPDPANALRFVVGRIAGFPGDTVEVEGSTLIVNGKSYTGESACAQTTSTVIHPSSGAEVDIHCDQVTMGGGWHYRGLPLRALPATRRRTEVGEGMLFLVSDDRAYPYDSRTYGTVEAATCTERIIFRLVSSGGWEDAENRLTYVR